MDGVTSRPRGLGNKPYDVLTNGKKRKREEKLRGDVMSEILQRLCFCSGAIENKYLGRYQRVTGIPFWIRRIGPTVLKKTSPYLGSSPM